MSLLMYRYRIFLSGHIGDTLYKIQTIWKQEEKMWKSFFQSPDIFTLRYEHNLCMLLHKQDNSICMVLWIAFCKNTSYVSVCGSTHCFKFSMTFQNYCYGTTLLLINIWIAPMCAPILIFISNWLPELEWLVQRFLALTLIVLLKNRGSILSVL